MQTAKGALNNFGSKAASRGYILTCNVSLEYEKSEATAQDTPHVEAVLGFAPES